MWLRASKRPFVADSTLCHALLTLALRSHCTVCAVAACQVVRERSPRRDFHRAFDLPCAITAPCAYSCDIACPDETGIRLRGYTAVLRRLIICAAHIPAEE